MFISRKFLTLHIVNKVLIKESFLCFTRNKPVDNLLVTEYWSSIT